MPTTTDTAARMAARMQQLREAIVREGWAALLVLDASDVAWLTGLRSSNAAVVVGASRTVVCTDFRYVAAAASLGLEVRTIAQALHSELGLVAAELAGPGAIAYEPSALSHRAFLQLADTLPEHSALRAVTSPVSRLRAVKDAHELEAIGRAAALVDEAFAHVATLGLRGRSERSVVWEVERFVRDRGATGMSFDGIVAGGANGAYPHHQPGDDEIPDDTLVTVDIGCVVDGYCSDATRTFAVGTPSARLVEAYELARRAQEAALGGVRAGAVGREVDAIARDIIADGGHAEHFGHGLGHGVGLDVHEAPRLARTSDEVLEEGNVVTVEPGIYIPGEGGVRIEDLVVVREHGCDVLNSFTKELVHA